MRFAQLRVHRFGVLGMVEETSQGLDFAVPRDGTSMANGSALKLKHQPLRKGVYPRQWTEKGSKEMDCRWWDLWDRCVGDYNTALARLEDKSPLGFVSVATLLLWVTSVTF